MDFFKEVSGIQSRIESKFSENLDSRDFFELSNFLLDYKNVDYGRYNTCGRYYDDIFDITTSGINFMDVFTHVEPAPKSKIRYPKKIKSKDKRNFRRNFISNLALNNDPWIPQHQNLSTVYPGIETNGRKIKAKNLNYSISLRKNDDDYFFVNLTLIPKKLGIYENYIIKYYICDQIDGVIEFLKFIFENAKPDEQQIL